MSTNRSDQVSTYGITTDEREEMLLGDIRFQIKRLADAVEQQNELLAAVTTDKGERP